MAGALWALLGGGCASIVPAAPVSVFPKEIVQRDVQEVGARAMDELKKIAQEMDAPALRTFASTVIQRLSAQDPLLNVAMPEVRVLRNASPPLRVVGLPGTRVFVPAELMRVVQYEAEFAAALAIELGHLSLRHYSRPAPPSGGEATLPDPPIFGMGGVLTYDDEQNLAAAAKAVELLYSAGYDPRGLVSYLSLLQRQKAKSPFDAALCARMMEKVREWIASRSPLLNPLLQSPEFRELKQEKSSPPASRKRVRGGSLPAGTGQRGV